MTRAQLRTLFQTLYPQLNSGKYDGWLDFALRWIAREFTTYVGRQFVRVAEGTSQYNDSALKPVMEESANGEEAGKLIRVQYQRGDSGTISAIADAGNEDNDAAFTSTAHGLSDGDVIEIHNTEKIVGGDDGTAYPNYDANNLTVSYISADTFHCSQAYNANYDTDRGVWIKSGSYRRWDLHPMTWQEVEESFYTDPVNPSSAAIPEGVLILTWRLVPPSIDYLTDDNTHLPSWILGREHHETLVHLAAMFAKNPEGVTLQADNFAARTAFTPFLAKMIDQLADDYRGRVPVEIPRYGKWRYQKGIYAYEPRGTESFIFNARDCW